MTNNNQIQGLYIHIPFCLSKCDYCDFYSLPVTHPEWLTRYTNCLIKDADMLPAPGALPVATIYLGGGTPSLLSSVDVTHLLTALRNRLVITPDAEISMEVNPARHESGYFENIKRAGVNRISLGVQSFKDQELKTLHRAHRTGEVKQTVEALHRVGLTNYNLDLIYGIPGQTMSSWAESLKQAVDYNPTHISIYLLQLNPVTPMAQRIKRGELQMPEDETVASMYYYALDYLKESGYKHYEISNFSRTGYECRHNLIYWHSQPYIGIGAGAVSFQGNRRFQNVADLRRYMECLETQKPIPVTVLEEMSPHDLLIDAVILGLRLTSGLNRQDFKERFGVDIIDLYRTQINMGVRNGLLSCENDIIALTQKGYFLSNQVLCQFLD